MRTSDVATASSKMRFNHLWETVDAVVKHTVRVLKRNFVCWKHFIRVKTRSSLRGKVSEPHGFT